MFHQVMMYVVLDLDANPIFGLVELKMQNNLLMMSGYFRRLSILYISETWWMVDEFFYKRPSIDLRIGLR